jgi:hypothetical protein
MDSDLSVYVPSNPKQASSLGEGILKNHLFLIKISFREIQAKLCMNQTLHKLKLKLRIL